MIKQSLIVFTLCLIAIFIQGAFLKSFSPAMIAPDILLILVVKLAISYRSPFAMISAFLIGIIGDLSTAQFIGPEAAGSVLAFALAVFLSQKIYSEQILSVIMITFACSIVKSISYITMVAIYADLNVLTGNIPFYILIEASLTAVLSPIIFSILKPKRN